jgi:hypothetical protein
MSEKRVEPIPRELVEATERAHLVQVQPCDCGCNGVLLILLTEDRRVIGFASMDPDCADNLAMDVQRVAEECHVEEASQHGRL